MNKKGMFNPLTQEKFFDRQKAIQKGDEGEGKGMAFTKWWPKKAGLPVSAVVFQVLSRGPMKIVEVIETVNEKRYLVGHRYVVGVDVPEAIARQAEFRKFITGDEKLAKNVLSVKGGYIALELAPGKKLGSRVVRVVATSHDDMSDYHVGQTWVAASTSIPEKIRDRVIKLFPEIVEKMAA